jgi:hypothetical protein
VKFHQLIFKLLPSDLKKEAGIKIPTVGFKKLKSMRKKITITRPLHARERWKKYL